MNSKISRDTTNLQNVLQTFVNNWHHLILLKNDQPSVEDKREEVKKMEREGLVFFFRAQALEEAVRKH